MTCKFCDEVRRRLAAIVDVWIKQKAINPHLADEIDCYYREQYRRAAEEEEHGSNNHEYQA